MGQLNPIREGREIAVSGVPATGQRSVGEIAVTMQAAPVMASSAPVMGMHAAAATPIDTPLFADGHAMENAARPVQPMVAGAGNV